MPFTLAHPAAALPLHALRSRWLDPAALIIGSLLPDTVYFLTALPVTRAQSHSLAGVFWFALPLGLLMLAVYRVLLQEPLVDLAPAPLRSRLRAARLHHPPPWRMVPILLSLVLGALTHLGWDYVTHESVETVLPVENEPLGEFMGYRPGWLNLFKHGSSILGLGVLGWFIWRWYRRTPPVYLVDSRSMRSSRRISAILAICCAATIAGAGAATRHFTGPLGFAAFRDALREGVIAAISAGALALLVYGLLHRLTGGFGGRHRRGTTPRIRPAGQHRQAS
jgi:hypothetical protein